MSCGCKKRSSNVQQPVNQTNNVRIRFTESNQVPPTPQPETQMNQQQQQQIDLILNRINEVNSKI
jgi:hypothetical protein